MIQQQYDIAKLLLSLWVACPVPSVEKIRMGEIEHTCKLNNVEIAVHQPFPEKENDTCLFRASKATALNFVVVEEKAPCELFTREKKKRVDAAQANFLSELKRLKEEVMMRKHKSPQGKE